MQSANIISTILALQTLLNSTSQMLLDFKI